ncbi:M48 family metalloprotease [Hymenobacter guriensis]|uniref:M48 family metalloprotease n=1 Tax=Hymenobacter guriensis TaxID=2793065 RepID=A0ABS0L606_9BACT|nr:M48 family metalloprotease [Hymenobacter guriensis]MBG8555560.1 M48 family metalloprotease [Hymenobacter guriensis]
MTTSLSRTLRTGALLGLLLPLGSMVGPATPANAVAPVQGAQPDPQVVAQFGLLDNAALQQFMDQKGSAMGRISDRPNDVKGFTVLDSPIINAFATPDGHVYFTRGILAYFNDEAQFSGVLGHEIGHITARHGQKQQTRSTIANGALILGSLLSKRVASLAQPASQVVGLGLLKYGRDDESESDQLGVKYSTKIGYDASRMADFFQTLQRTEQASGAASVPTFLSSHPNSANRYTTVKKLAAQAKQGAGNRALATNHNGYLQRLDGLVYGDDPRQGYVQSGYFYHPDLKIQFPVPTGWKSQNTPQQFQMAEPSGKAVQILTAAPGSSLDEAAQALAKQLNLQSPQASRTTLNGFPALAIQGNQVGEQGVTAATLSYIIQDGQTMYALIGMCGPQTLGTYGPTFQRVAQGFKRLTDAAKINKAPERIRLRTAKAGQTLASALAANGIPSKRYEEMAILNGMQTSTKLTAGQLYKVVGK